MKKIDRKTIYLILASFLFLILFSFYTFLFNLRGDSVLFAFSSPIKKTQIVFVNNQNREIKVSAEIADDLNKRTRGLSYRDSLPKDEGMLFIFNEPVIPSFWMKQVTFPLDLIFIDENFRIQDVRENFPPCSATCPLYTPEEPIKYVLEVNGGFVEENGVNLGSEVKIEL